MIARSGNKYTLVYTNLVLRIRVIALGLGGLRTRLILIITLAEELAEVSYIRNPEFQSLILTYTAKNVASCNKSVDNKPISGCVRMACNRLLTTSLLQVVSRLYASCRVIHRLVTSCFNKLFQQVATSLQMTSCNKPDFNKLVAT